MFFFSYCLWWWRRWGRWRVITIALNMSPSGIGMKIFWTPYYKKTQPTQRISDNIIDILNIKVTSSFASFGRSSCVTLTYSPLHRKIRMFSGNIKVGWLKILLEALEKSSWPCLRNTVRGEVLWNFRDREQECRGGIAYFCSWKIQTNLFRYKRGCKIQTEHGS